MDLVGPLPETPRGHKYIMTLTDYYTKWAEAAALKALVLAHGYSCVLCVSCNMITRIVIEKKKQNSYNERH